MFCRFCGQKIAKDSMFCPYCGKQLSLQTVEENISSPATEPAPIPSMVEPTAPQSDSATETPVTEAPRSQHGRWVSLGLFVLILAVGIATLFFTKVLCFHQWQDATCTEPFICSRCGDTKGKKLRHTIISATCTDPVTCTTCCETFGSALGHSMRQATCTKARYCFRCQKNFGTALGHSWVEETFDTPKTCNTCGKICPMTQPATGTIYIESSKYCGSRLTLNAAADYNTYLKIKDENGNDVISFYVRAGETADVRVPSGTYSLYFAHGYDWYGPEHAFGSETFYEKADEPLDFYNYTWTYTLDAGEDGNASSTIITENEF